MNQRAACVVKILRANSSDCNEMVRQKMKKSIAWLCNCVYGASFCGDDDREGREMQWNGASEDALSSLVNADTRCELLWQGCHYKDEPPLNAPPKHADLRMRPLNTRIYTAHYIPSRAHTLPKYSLCLHLEMPQSTSHTYLPVYCGDTFELFRHLLIQRGLHFLPPNIYAWFSVLPNIFSQFSVGRSTDFWSDFRQKARAEAEDVRRREDCELIERFLFACGGGGGRFRER